MKQKAIIIAIAGAACLLAIACLSWHMAGHHRKANGPKMVYDPHGYGGFVAANEPKRDPVTSKTGAIDSAVSAARNAYDAGNFVQSEKVASSLVVRLKPSVSLASRMAVADARQVLAYDAARRHDLALARDRFSLLQQTASTLPGGGAQSVGYGDQEPTLEQEAAFEHAVCTAALGDTAAAETEYRKFLYGFPDSPLVHAATERIARMHGGNLPAVDMTAWKHAQTTALSDQRAEARNEAMCGPDCVAELLRRHGISVGTGALARKMGTSERGTSLAALAVALERRGLKTQGLKLDEVGLARQKLPIIALLAPGHYVIVDRVGDQSVSLWDPDGKGLNIGGPKTFSLRDWRRSWQGIALRMDGTVTANQATIATSVVRPSNGI